MDHLTVLRALVDRQQFLELDDYALACWQDTGDAAVLPLRALALTQTGQRQTASAVLATVLPRVDELDADARCDLAAACIVLGRPEQARDLLLNILDEAPDHPLALARLAWCRSEDGDGAAARWLYERSAALAPHRLPVHVGLVRVCLDGADTAAAQGAIDTALPHLDAMLARPAAHQAFKRQLQLLQLETWNVSGSTARAEAWLDARRVDLPEADWVALLLGQAQLLARSNRHAEAEDALRLGLAHLPDNIALRVQLAELAHLLGRPAQAALLLRQAIRLASNEPAHERIGLWLRLSGACLLHDRRWAGRAAQRALALATALQDSDDLTAARIARLRADANTALAQVESQGDDFDAAERLYRAVLDHNPYHLAALEGYGQQQMRRGRIDEAIALFERIKAIHPAKGHAVLIHARRFPDDTATLGQLERYARQPGIEGALHSGLILKLAAAWEQHRDFDRAFDLATEANATARKLLRYDAKAHRQSCARVRKAFCKPLYEHRRDCGVDTRLPVYVVGMPRSGTTLVEQILAGHSRVCGAGELGLIPGVIQGMERWERHTGSGRHYPDCIDDLSPRVTAGIAAKLLDELAAFRPGADRVVDKLPHNFQNIGLIKFLFPKAQIISVRRDPRDIAISNFFTDYQAKHAGMGFAYDLADIGEQLADHNLLMQHWHRLFPGEILELDYEDVVDHTEAAARRLIDHLGLEWEPQVLDFNLLDRPVKTASVWQVRQPIYATSKARWANYRDHLGALIRATNARIETAPIDDMVTLPEPGLLGSGMAFYHDDRLDDAERCFKKLLHHLPEHGAANFMTGLIGVRKGHLATGIALMERGLAACPWNTAWRADLVRACELNAEPARAEAVRRDARQRPAESERASRRQIVASSEAVHG